MSTRRDRRRRRRTGRALVPVEACMPAPASPPVQHLAVLTPEILVQVVRIDRQVRWQRRRELVTVDLPRAVLGRRVADGLGAVPFRFGLLAFVGLVLLRDLDVRGAVPVTLCGIAVGVGIGLALLQDVAGQGRKGIAASGTGSDDDGYDDGGVR